MTVTYSFCSEVLAHPAQSIDHWWWQVSNLAALIFRFPVVLSNGGSTVQACLMVARFTILIALILHLTFYYLLMNIWFYSYVLVLLLSTIMCWCAV